MEVFKRMANETKTNRKAMMTEAINYVELTESAQIAVDCNKIARVAKSYSDYITVLRTEINKLRNNMTSDVIIKFADCLA